MHHRLCFKFTTTNWGYSGEWRHSSTHFESLHYGGERSDASSGYFAVDERASCKFWVACCVGSGTILDFWIRGKTLSLSFLISTLRTTI